MREKCFSFFSLLLQRNFIPQLQYIVLVSFRCYKGLQKLCPRRVVCFSFFSLLLLYRSVKRCKKKSFSFFSLLHEPNMGWFVMKVCFSFFSLLHFNEYRYKLSLERVLVSFRCYYSRLTERLKRKSFSFFSLLHAGDTIACRSKLSF